MKKFLVAILALIDVVCGLSVFYLLFSTPSVGRALLSIILPTIIGWVAAAIIGKLTSPETQAATGNQPHHHSA